MANSVIPFLFENYTVRAVTIDGQPWFIASDVCEALTIVDVGQAIERLDDDERGGYAIPTPGGMQTVRTVSESGMYSLTLSSRKLEAKRFKKWVTSEVLPTIRKTGSYTAPGQSPVTERTAAALLVAEYSARMLRLSGSSLLDYMGRVTERLAPELIGTLPVYAINAPIDQIGVGSSEPAFSLSVLSKQHNTGLSAAKLNERLLSKGFIAKLTRPSTKGEKAFWSITDKGLMFGCNLTNPSNQRETQPVWFASRFPALLAELSA